MNEATVRLAKDAVREMAAVPALRHISRPAAAPDVPCVFARDVRKSFGSYEVLSGVDLDVHRGEVVCLTGPSGSGKSTFLRCLNNLEPINSGALYVNGKFVGYDVRNGRFHPMSEARAALQRSEIGMVFQRFNLFDHMTALQNIVEAPIRVRGVTRAEAREQAEDLLAKVGLSQKRDAYPSELSGGQQQRIAIARALAMRPALMLFDEPTSALDPELVGEVLTVMRDLAREGMTMIVVTHEMGFAREVGDRVVFLDGGRVLDQGPPGQMLTNASDERARAFYASILL